MAVPPERRTRRERSGDRHGDQVIDLRAAAASRGRTAARGSAPDPGDLDLAAADPALRDAVRTYGGEEALPGLHELGRHCGARATRELAAEVERSPARLDAYDDAGERVDRVVHHPGWRALLRDGAQAGLTGRPWASGEPHAHLERAASLLLWAQVSGSAAAQAATHHAATAAVVGGPAAASWLPRLASRRVDVTSRRGSAARATSAGLALSEQGGSDTRAATTRAVTELGGPLDGGPTWRLSGRKWFVGNADADVLVVSAATDDGPGTFLVPRSLPGTGDDGLRLLRLRHGRARRAWVVGDVELDDAWAVRLDDENAPGGEALARVAATQHLDGTVLAAAAVRAALWRAGHHARRSARPGGPLDTAPLLRTVLADLAVESEAATLLALRLAAATDGTEADAALLRLAGPVAASWLSRRAPQVTLEALELAGAAAWDETGVLARLHRDAGAVLAGATANGLAVDVVRVVAGDPDAVAAFIGECDTARGHSPRLDAGLDALADLLRTAASEAQQDPAAVEAAARWLVERMALALQASLVARHAPDAVTEAWLGGRLESPGTRGLGTAPLGVRQTAVVLDRALGAT
ncbi:acyl-CoA dehydrogenase family protein [Aquipuribacter nitratireducens]|uniref:Acyl-CoA dehydrogenase family protein n=1 Tax=Aquipuribacter nitratireducens TaxID=650104 RepID=A0ABW0GSH9_9MICO